MSARRTVTLGLAAVLTACAGEGAQPVKNVSFSRPSATYVIAAMGDSFGSGEGNPRYGNGDWETTEWYSSSRPEMSQMCHRSSESGFYKAVRRLEARYPNVEFVRKNFACSGAVAQELIMSKQVPEHETFRSYGVADVGATQLDQLREWLADVAGASRLDALYLSIGGNNAGFGPAIVTCIEDNDGADVPCYEREDVTRGARIASERTSGPDDPPTLWELYGYIDTYAARSVNPHQVVISTYPNFAKLADGSWCDSEDFPLSLIGPSEWEGAWEAIGAPMNTTITRRAAELGWDVAEMEDRFLGHAICEADRWVNNDEDASGNQGNDLSGFFTEGWLSTGIVHPNDDGYEAYADAIEAELDAKLRDRMTPDAAVRISVSNAPRTPTRDILAGTGVTAADPWRLVTLRGPAAGSGIDAVSSLRVRVVLAGGRESLEEYVAPDRRSVYVQAPAGARISVAACGFQYGSRRSNVLCGEASLWNAPVSSVAPGTVVTTRPGMTIVPPTTSPRPGSRPTTVPTTRP